MKRRLRGTGRLVALALVVLWSVFPVYWALKTSLSTNAAAQQAPAQLVVTHPIWASYQALFGAGPENADAAGGIARSLINIVVETVGATLLTLVIAVVGAYAFARMRFRLKGAIFYVVIATLTLPVYATLIPLYRIMSDLGLVNTYLGIILVYTSGFLPLALWIMYNVFMALPASIEEAARIDGATTLQAFRRVVVPTARPGIVATGNRDVPVRLGTVYFPARTEQQQLDRAAHRVTGRYRQPQRPVHDHQRGRHYRRRHPRRGRLFPQPLDCHRNYGREHEVTRGSMSTNIVVLNGGSSSGKTSIARCLQGLLPGSWLKLGVDDLIEAMPGKRDQRDLITFTPDGGVSVGPGFRRLEAAWAAGIAAMARAGVGVIVDDVFLGGGSSQARLRRGLSGLEVLWVGVRCDAAVAAAREAARPDRVPGMAAAQAEVVHRGVDYDVEVDTTANSVLACAELIQARVIL